MPSIYYPEFIAANQSDRANNVMNTGSKQKDLERIRADIRDFKVSCERGVWSAVWLKDGCGSVSFSRKTGGYRNGERCLARSRP